MTEEAPYDVVIVGGGASGTALLYTLAKYTNIARIALIEKNVAVAQVNSRGRNNSQTLHIGDIETNYTLEKATSVKPAALMIPHYVAQLPTGGEKILFPVSKMVLGVGSEEVAKLKERFAQIKDLYPDLVMLNREGIERVEPNVVKGRSLDEPILALYTPRGYAVDYEQLATSFVQETKRMAKAGVNIFLGEKVLDIKKVVDIYELRTNRRTIRARTVVVDADAYSLFLAKQLGYGHEFSLIPVAGNFYFTDKLLNGKVYSVQEKELPFAAVHGDPDIQVQGKTRWGPTARFFPVLESGKLSTSIDYFRSAGLFRMATLKSFAKILGNGTQSLFLLKNLFFEIPFVGNALFARSVRKIVPTVHTSQIHKAKGFGGMRLQRVDTRTGELQLGEGKITGDRIIFNMTPSPGASVCLHNALRDAALVTGFFGDEFSFDQARMESELCGMM